VAGQHAVVAEGGDLPRRAQVDEGRPGGQPHRQLAAGAAQHPGLRQLGRLADGPPPGVAGGMPPGVVEPGHAADRGGHGDAVPDDLAP